MTEDWKTVKSVLLEVIELDPSRRKEFLNGPTIPSDVRAEVESLLAHENSVEDFMSISARGFAGEIVATSNPSQIGQRIGIYETISELGLGGMGVVYLAARRDGKFEQKVAIKLLKREFNTAKIRQIFQREKEILAKLSIPGIASLLDSGTTDDGIPYLVMEYVEGEPIDLYCHRRKLSLDARLKLFNKVCDTVARAHRSLIVHRDLKPSNILVNSDGDPKLLDFGISKLLDVEADKSEGVTQLGAMTPQYASPEQIRGEAVTTATDVYSLGVVLFKILTGHLPTLVEKNHSPTLPSEVALKSESELTYSPGALKGDLDNVVLKALRYEPDQRYQSVQNISDDIWRFIDGMPVLARPSTISYRLSKFVSRNKVQVIAAVFVVVALLVGIAIALSQAKSAREQARLAREQRDVAQQERERAEKTSKFMQSFLNYANPHWSGQGSRVGGRTDFTVREALQDVVTRMDTELADSPEVRADLHYTIAEVYSTSRDKRAFQHFRTSLELYRQVHGDEHPKVARAMYYVSGYETNNEKGEQQLRQAILIMRRTDPENVNLPHMLQAMGHRITKAEGERRDASRLAEAEALILEAQSIFIRTEGESANSTTSTYSTLAFLALARGDLARSERLREEVLRRYLQTHEGLYQHIWALVYLGEVKLKLGKNAEAETMFQQSLELARQRWSANDRHRLTILVDYLNKVRAANSK